MSGYRRVNYYELCRLCTSNKGTKLHIFKEEGKKRHIAAKIQLCLRLQVNEQDSLPKLICNICLEKLESFYNFRTNCANAETMLESARKLSLTSDFEMNGKVYVKENVLDDDNMNQETIINSTIVHENSLLLREDNELKVSSQQSEIVAVPLSINNLGQLVQGATIHILPEKEIVKLQSNLKTTVQVQHSLDSIAGEHSYSFNVQEQCTEAPVSVKVEENITNFITDSCTQIEKDDILSNSSEMVGSTSPDDSRNSMSQIGEFLKLKSIGNNEENEDNRCENCGLLFNTNIDKTNHTLTCVGESIKIREPVVMVDIEEDKTVVNCGPYSCDDCLRVFKRKEHLVQHRRLHTGERPFKCSQCKNTFSRKEHLLRHEVCHTGEKHYPCTICGKSFGRKDNVAKHMRTHQKTFSTERLSVREETPNLSIKCDFCGNEFNSAESLRNHVTSRHTISDKCDIMILDNQLTQPVSILEKALKQIPD